MIARRAVVQSLAAAAVAALPGLASRKPNLVVLLADDLGYGDAGCFGSPDVRTPYIDSIAAKGARFTDGYVTACVCSPSRAGFMTGRYQQRFGHEFNPDPPMARELERHLGLPLTEITLPQLLKKAGYATGIVGKWHLGMSPELRPTERGFDEFFGFLPAMNSYVTDKTPDADWMETEKAPKIGPRTVRIFRGREPVEEPEYLTDAFGREAVAFIERHKREPFFLYLPFNAVHSPYQSTKRYVDRFANIKDRRHRMLAAMTGAMDDNIGKVLGTLRANGLENDTVVFFFSDNGCPTFTKTGSNGPLNGSKITLYEGGIRIPFCMQWPGHVAGGQVYRHPISSLDLLPTLVKLAGVELPRDREYDGVDLMPFLTGKADKYPHDALFWRHAQNSAARLGNWKLLQIGEDRSRLYDLVEDIGEKHDLSQAKPEVVKEMRAALGKWNAKLIAPRWEPQGTSPLTFNGEEIFWAY